MDTENKKAGIIKKSTKIVNMVTTGLLIANGTFLGHQGYIAFRLHNNKDKSQKQIAEDTLLFETDLQNYIKDRFNKTNQRRLAHNGGEPIYVSIDKKFTEQEVERIKASFTYMENIFKDINPNYRFAYADNNLANVFLGKTTIDVKRDENLTVEGSATASRNSFFRTDYLLNSEIMLRPQEDMESTWFEGVTLHEILHLFQLGDVYINEVGKDFANTFINVENSLSYIPELTPQDYKALHAIYNKSYVVNGEIDSKKLAETVNLIKAYENNYYGLRYDFFADNVDGKYNFHYISEQEANGKVFNFSKINYDTKVELNNGKYKVTVTNIQSNEVVSSDTGDYIMANGGVVIKNVNTHRSYYNPSAYATTDRITDFMIMKIDNTYRIVDVYEIASSKLISEEFVGRSGVELRNKFFANKQRLLALYSNDANTYYSMPNKQKFSIEMDEEMDSLGLFR